MTLTFPGPPQFQHRHRDRGNGMGKYDPSKGAKNVVAWEAKAQGARPIEGPVRMTVEAVFPRLTRHPKKRPGAPTKTTKPDWDNVGKLYSDALNGIAYDDDAQIVEGIVRKRYADLGEAPHVRIDIEPAT